MFTTKRPEWQEFRADSYGLRAVVTYDHREHMWLAVGFLPWDSREFEIAWDHWTERESVVEAAELWLGEMIAAIENREVGEFRPPEPTWDEFTLGPCGCTDYHLADCPLITG